MSKTPEVRRGGGLPWAQIVSQWACDPRYSTNLRTLYGILVTYADTDSRDTSKGKPYRVELARQLGVSEKTVDRVVFEGECAGLWWVEQRSDPENPNWNDANVYHLLDRDFWKGNWSDPLGPNETAAEVAKARTAERVKAKRDAGIMPKGGRRKKPDALVDGADQPEGGVTGDATHEAVDNPRGGVTGDGRVASPVTPRPVTGDGRVASPVTPNIQSPVQSPVQSPPEAPSGRVSAPDARRASTGSSARPTRGGCAASGKTSTAGDKRTAEAVHAVVAALPDELRRLESRPLPERIPARPLGDLIRHQLKDRTPEQLAERIARRWVEHRWDEKCHSAMDGEPLRSGVGIAVELLKAPECPDLSCEDGVIIGGITPCRACPERHADYRAARQAGKADQRSESGLPSQRPAAAGRGVDRWRCAGRDGECRAVAYGSAPADQLCQDCRKELEEIRTTFAAAGFVLEPQEAAPASL